MATSKYSTQIKLLSKVIIFILLGTISGTAQTPAKTIPSFTFKKLDKSEFSMKNLQEGKFHFFVFFDTHCDHCHRAIQYINQNYEQFKNTNIYLITLDSADKIKTFMNIYGKVINSKKNVFILQDTNNEFITKFGPRKYPSLYLYSKMKELILYEDNEQYLFRFIQHINTSVK